MCRFGVLIGRLTPPNQNTKIHFYNICLLLYTLWILG